MRGASLRALICTLGLVIGAAAPALAAERGVSIDGGKAPLYGTLETPDHPASGVAVLFIAGSGPTDRNGDSVIPGVKPATQRLLAKAFADAGFASLRYDKRGIAASGPAAPPEAQLTLGVYVADAVVWARFLGAQPGVRCVVLMGHSEGALIAILAGAKTPVCGLISASGGGRPAADILESQLKAASLPSALLADALHAVEELRAGRLVPNPPPMSGVFRPSVQPYLISELSVDPARALGAVKSPILILQGGADLQVSVADAETLAAARPDAKLVVLPGVNHVLKSAPADRAGNLATYADPDLPLAPDVAEAVIGFVRALSVAP